MDALVLTGILWGYSWYARQIISSITDVLQDSFDITSSGVATLSSGILITFSIMQIPAGLILEILSPEFCIVIGSFFMGICCLLFGFANNFIIGLVINIFLGISTSLVSISDLALIEERYGNVNLVLVTSVTQAIGIGIYSLCQYIQAKIYQEYHIWREMFYFYGISVMITAVMYFIYMCTELKCTKIHEHIVDSTENEFKDMKRVRVFKSMKIINEKDKMMKELLNKLKLALCFKWNWYLSFLLIFTNSILVGLSFLWLIPFLEIKYNIERSLAALINGILTFSWAFGAIIFGKIIKMKYGKRRKISLLIGIILQQLLMLIIYADMDRIYYIIILCAVSGFGSSVSLIIYNMVRDYNPTCMNAATGLISFMNFFGGMIIQVIIGILLDYSWKKHNGIINENGMRQYCIQDYQLSFIIFPILGILSLIMLIFLKETYGEPIKWENNNNQKIHGLLTNQSQSIN